VDSAHDKLELIGRLVLEALSKARELSKITLDDKPDLRRRASELMKAARDSSEKIEALTEGHGKNGKLDKATLERGLDRIIKAQQEINRELDDLLAKARG
jgi:hypothetical protein